MDVKTLEKRLHKRLTKQELLDFMIDALEKMQAYNGQSISQAMLHAAQSLGYLPEPTNEQR